MVSSPGWRSRPSEEADISLNLQDVDPDVAALLSPNKLATPQPITPFVRRHHPSSLPRLRPRMSVTPPPESPGISLGSPGPSGRMSPRPPHSPHRPSPPSPLGRIRPSPVRASSHEALLPALEATPTGQTSIYPPPRGTVSSRPSLDVPPPPSAERTRKRSMSATTPPRSLGMSDSRGSVEWLGPRTFKAFRAAGLLEDTPSQHIRAGSMGDVRDKYTAVEPMHRFGGTLSRLGSRSDRSASRLSSSRRSPSSMAESPRSASTAPTRSSTAPSSVIGWEDDSAAKHAMEMSALLGALSDSQRTAKMLRDDNDELRDRLDSTERERDRLERERDRLEELLKERDEELTAVAGRSSGVRDEDERLNDLEDENALLRSVVDELRREIGDILGSTSGPMLPPSPLATGEADARLFGSHSSRPMQSTPKRMSSASSIFPAVPPNMTMLMSDESQEERWDEEEEEEEEEDCRQWDQSIENDADQSMMEDSFDTEEESREEDEGEPTWTVRKSNVRQSVRQSIVSDLSFLTGDEESLRSLALRPEHEMHLQDLDGMSIYDMPSAS
ncbi:hypothetical protein CYLTODRAFT_154774 [Cylindrobasidium torrendii FP15055 ss-10]|uniref:Uncharacterized protein n=1 Tax=Cylindrobasidium torrendii FP15055 ss-10 TaxID=1314674 RepID=A0A0D7BU37_9AGAR|nr:hypothetical protein CYLTODRAFT_154774 [Cylindrobasidium torrendii FP15055 ss-10]